MRSGAWRDNYGPHGRDLAEKRAFVLRICAVPGGAGGKKGDPAVVNAELAATDRVAAGGWDHHEQAVCLADC